ncbi:GIY-YIG nuclease family protein [Agromyces sp. ISL-38]|uniref:NUMOD3 domain-containing DNA-binding protein n=1 Tax=Agromyces sp. ISL-38 TaxID=2819107 RepID=UPI001BE52061|nr:NUMOD3 domain-containing DNA-binding protein [Agromyces sp. ISL-38]MBT2499404.1 GIY-YIG nuclease family protein [Agromyces sp. ISL-38]
MIETVEWSPELGQGAPIVGTVYGFRVRATGEYRYVGQTTKTLRRRMSEHRKVARKGRKTPFYDWLRKSPDDAYEVVVLEHVVTTREDLGHAEIGWIALYRATGDRLLNLSEGGLGPTGVVWTDEQRKAAGDRARGRPTGVHRFGADSPVWGRTHSDEQKAKWSAMRKGSYSGPENPNFGKFGADHPSFGHTMSAESRERLSEMRRGELNPNFGKTASDETRAKMSAVRKDRPMPSSVRSAHTRHHTNKGVFKETCRHCVDDQNNERGTS